MLHSKVKRLTLILVPVMLIGLLVPAVLLYIRSIDRSPPIAIKVMEASHQPHRGSKTAPIQIVLFEDLKCLNCAIFNKALLPQIEQKYIKTGIANYTFYNLAFIPGSLPAANAARCLYAQNPDYFFKFIDYVYAHQPPERKNWANMTQLLQFAKQAIPGVNLNMLSECIVEGRYNKAVNNNFKYAEKIMANKPATPTMYINGRLLRALSLKEVDELVALGMQDSHKDD